MAWAGLLAAAVPCGGCGARPSNGLALCAQHMAVGWLEEAKLPSEGLRSARLPSASPTCPYRRAGRQGPGLACTRDQRRVDRTVVPPASRQEPAARAADLALASSVRGQLSAEAAMTHMGSAKIGLLLQTVSQFLMLAAGIGTLTLGTGTIRLTYHAPIPIL